MSTNKLTAKEAIAILQEKYSKEELIYQDVDSIVEGIGVVEVAEQVGGMGQGDDYHVVYHLPIHGLYLKQDGWYSSQAGAEAFDDLQEVSPRQKTITVYE